VKILIADDSIVSRHLLEATVRSWGYEVVGACDGLEALDLLQRPDAPGLAILDWMMPGLTGPEVCARIRQHAREPYTYILLLTSKSLKEDLIQGMESGADDYVTKPFDRHELQVRLRAGKRLVDMQAELLAAREALRDQATHDSLTHIWNRNAILELLGRELARGARENSPLGIAIFDIDRFKSVNDQHGHPAGDAVLREAARRIQGGMRQYDAIGRYGGEEFVVLLPGCDEINSLNQSDRLRNLLSQTEMRVNDVSLTITASFGVTTAHGSHCHNTENLIRRADEALYLAKKLGRNRVEFLAYDAQSVRSEVAAVQEPVAR
jgi:two-component system, cell cycle response regulator